MGTLVDTFARVVELRDVLLNELNQGRGMARNLSSSDVFEG